eukprot:753917-Hanusia_phi.AAC.1
MSSLHSSSGLYNHVASTWVWLGSCCFPRAARFFLLFALVPVLVQGEVPPQDVRSLVRSYGGMLVNSPSYDTIGASLDFHLARKEKSRLENVKNSTVTLRMTSQRVDEAK